MVVINFVPVWCHTRGDDMQVQVVGNMVCIDDPWLSEFGIPHFLFLAGDGYMELRFSDPIVTGTVPLQEFHLLVGRGRLYHSDRSEVMHLQQVRCPFWQHCISICLTLSCCLKLTVWIMEQQRALQCYEETAKIGMHERFFCGWKELSSKKCRISAKVSSKKCDGCWFLSSKKCIFA